MTGTNAMWEKVMKKLKGKRLTRTSAIKNYCKMECCAGDNDSWKNCTIPNCFLWRYRLGKEIKDTPKKHIVFPLNSSKNEVLQTISGVRK